MSLSHILFILVGIPCIISGIVTIAFMIVALVYRIIHPADPEDSEQPSTESELVQTAAPIETQSFPEILKSHRTARHMSQEYLAEQLGVTRQAVSKWESGTSEPSTANLLALAKLYGISLDELVGLK